MKDLVKIYNKKASNQLSLQADSDIDKALSNDISFPIGFSTEAGPTKKHYNAAIRAFYDVKILN